jgi:hypothetical protein
MGVCDIHLYVVVEALWVQVALLLEGVLSVQVAPAVVLVLLAPPASAFPPFSAVPRALYLLLIALLQPPPAGGCTHCSALLTVVPLLVSMLLESVQSECVVW